MDDATIRRARGGDRAAMVALFQQLEPSLLRLVRMRLDPALRRRLDPADVVQQAWIDAVERFPSWCARPELPFQVWARLVTSEALSRAHRHHLGARMRDAMLEARRIDSRASVSAAALTDELVAGSTSPTQAARREEVRSRVLAALEELDEVDREIVALRQFEGLSNEDAATELGIDPSAASKRFLRALVRLRPALQLLARDGETSA